MTTILGISAFYHDSSAALVVDGEIVAAAQEEAFTRIKHDFDFPKNAITFCLEKAGISGDQIDYVAFYEKPLIKFERLLESYLGVSPKGFKTFKIAMPLWLHQKLYLGKEMREALENKYKKRFVYLEHHESHAASAFFPSPFEEAAILTLDGVGEWATTSTGVGRGSRIELLNTINFPHSIGLLYSAFTYFCGFKVNSGEYKLMGLAPYGDPVYTEKIKDHLIDLKEDGSFLLNMDYFDYVGGEAMTNQKFESLFGGPPRKPESPLTQREMDLAASIQKVTEEILLKITIWLHKETGIDNLCMAGGVALNCVANGRILREGPFKNLWIQPAAGDAGGALGAALFVWNQLLKKERKVGTWDSQKGSRLGPSYTNTDIENFLNSEEAVYKKLEDDELIEDVAHLIKEGKVVGWMNGPLEFGPRALGGRSILGDPRSRDMQSVMNLKIKFRESFRPFAPSVLEEHVHEFFDVPEGYQSPYMLLVDAVKDDRRVDISSEANALKGLDRLKVQRSEIPAITHVDYSARIQTVGKDSNPMYRRLIQKFYELTGCPLLINTSFNVRGEPIVNSPENAYRCFLATQMDVLVMENFVLLKEEQKNVDQDKIQEYLSKTGVD